MRRLAFRLVPLLAAVLGSAVLPIHAEVRSWDFSYVTDKVAVGQPPEIWFSTEADGTYGERITTAPLSPEGDATVLYLHSLSTGLSGIDVTLSPIAEDGSEYTIGYVFTASGGIVDGDKKDYEEDVSSDEVRLSLSGDGTVDPPLVRVERLYELTWTPDVTDIENAGVGIYTCSLEVEVSYV